MPSSLRFYSVRVLLLLQQWWVGVVLGGSLLVLSMLGLAVAWNWTYALRWLLPASLVLIYVFGYMRQALGDNHRPGDDVLLPHLGLGTTMTMARGLLAALLAGFLLVPQPTGPLAWAPALLYLAIGVADFLDGYLARIRDHVTVLGGKLDVTYDALATLIAVGLVVQYGQVPAIYLIVGIAFYAFQIHMRLRLQQGKRVWPLPPSTHRRFLAGCHYGFLAVILAPVFTPPITWLGAALFGGPILLGFARDWLVATGRVDTHGFRYRYIRSLSRDLLLAKLPPLLRIVAVGAGLVLAFQSEALPVPPVVLFGGLTVLALGLAFVAVGWIARTGSMLLLASGCLHLLLVSVTPVNALLIGTSIMLWLLGPGQAVRWDPEAAYLMHRRGAPRLRHQA